MLRYGNPAYGFGAVTRQQGMLRHGRTAAAVNASLTIVMQDVIEGKDYNFPKQEEHVLKFWEDTDAFKQQLKRSEGKKPYVFYDGPPFATGLPHYGHLLAGTLKVRSRRLHI